MSDKYRLLIDELNYLGKKVTPVPEQPVNILFNLIGLTGNDGSSDRLNYLSSNPNSVDGDYQTAKSTIAKNIARVLNNALYVARNKINPIVSSIIEQINIEKQKENDITLASGLYDRDIVTVAYPNVLTDPMFLSIIDESSSGLSSYKQSEFDDIMSPLRNMFTTDEIKYLMTTGSTELDSQILGLLGKNYDFNKFKVLDSYLFDSNLWELIGVFFILYGISNNRLEKVEFFTSNSNNKRVLDYAIRYVASMIRSLMNTWMTGINSGNIIIFNSKLKPYHLFNSIGKSESIFTNEVPYTKWLNEKGGTPEAIYGFCYSLKNNNSSSPVYESYLIDNPEKFVKVYNDKLNINKGLIADNINKAINNATLNVIQKTINDELDELTKSTYIKNYMERVKPFEGFTDVHSYIRNAVCDTFTEGDTVKQLLSDTDNYLKNVDSNNIDLARRNALMNVIVKWLSKQVTIGKA